MKEQDELAETILALPDDTNIAYHTYRKGDYYLCDVETLQSIVREWKEMKQLLDAAESVSSDSWEVFQGAPQRWTGLLDGEKVTKYFDTPLEAFAAIQKENK